jgi:hypothetical protein
MRRARTVGGWMVVGLVAAGCRPVKEAPEDLAELMDRAWFAYHAEDEAEIDVLIEAVDTLIDVESLLDGYQDGRQNLFTAEHQALVPLRAPDDDDGTWELPSPAAATPLFFINRYTCDFGQLEEILVSADQEELYGSYDTYERSYEAEPEPFLAGEVDQLQWSGELTASVFPVGDYTYDFVTGIRRHEIGGEHPSAGQDAALVRTYIPVPVVWRTENRNYPQDYQIELYVPYEGDIVHVYAIWRQMELGSLGDMSGDTVARTTLVTFRQWDEKTEKLCDEGRP